jgi:hypothetical protein
MRLWIVLALAGCSVSQEHVDSDSESLSLQLGCIPTTAPPIIYSETIANPYALDALGNAPPGFITTIGRYEPPVPTGQTPIEYVSGGWMDFHIVAEPCAVVQSVQIGSVTMTPASAAANGYSLVVSTKVVDSAHTLFDLSAMYPSLGDGSTRPLIVTMARPGGSVATWSMQLVDAAEVVPRGNANSRTVTPVSLSEAEMTNSFIWGLWNEFNGLARATDYNGFRIDGPDYNSVQLAIEKDWGVSFTYRVSSNQGLCTEALNVTGTFMIQADFRKDLAVTWPWPVEVDPAVGNSCGIIQLLPFGNWVQDYLDSQIATNVQQRMEAALVKAFGSADRYAAYFDGARANNHELVLNLSTGLGPVVRFNVPWDAFDMGRSGTALPKTANVVMFAHGIGYEGGDPLWVGPAGVPNGPTDVAPQLASLPRDPGTLPFPSEPVAELLARTTPTVWAQPPTSYAYRLGCTLPSTTGSLHFGVNEAARAAEAARATPTVAPGYQLSLQFADIGTIACPSYTPAPRTLAY